MLRRIDSGLAIVAWTLAGVLALMLFVGPQVVAEDKPQEREAGAAPYATGDGGSDDGRAIFGDSCGSCHALSAAGTSGTVGPQLDGLGLDSAAVEQIVRTGSAPMPSFEGRLTDAQIEAVAEFVAEASR